MKPRSLLRRGLLRLLRGLLGRLLGGLRLLDGLLGALLGSLRHCEFTEQVNELGSMSKLSSPQNGHGRQPRTSG